MPSWEHIKQLIDLICKKHTVRPSERVLSRFTLSQQWVEILFDVSKLTMLKKDTPIASGVVVESEWVHKNPS
jgi:hypothetical protein